MTTNGMVWRERKVIKDNIDLLATSVQLNDNLLDQVINKNIFTQPMVSDIMAIREPMEQKKRFLQDLSRRGPEAYDTFVEILYGMGQMAAVEILKPDLLLNLKTEEVIENITNSPTDALSVTIGMASDAGDHSVGNNTVASIENEDFMITVQKCKKAMIGPNLYQMVSNPRGFCLIFNMFEFDNNCYSPRLGSESEANRLKDVFSQLHFSVEVFTNLTKEVMNKTLREYSRKVDLKRHDSLVIIVLSHGHSGYVVAADGLAIQFEDIISKFNNENCPQLIRRPKLFFFNCCRGDNRDSGPKYQFGEEAVADAKPWEADKKVPKAADIMICYSTVDGFVSWRNEENGSWFGTALSHSLMKHSHDKDLHFILTVASNLVSNKITKDGEKQVMEMSYRGWNKLFYFNPGINEFSPSSTTSTTSA